MIKELIRIAAEQLVRVGVERLVSGKSKSYAEVAAEQKKRLEALEREVAGMKRRAPN